MSLTVITPTGARPEAFAVCAAQMACQTYEGPVSWLVVDDGELPTHIPPMPDNWTVQHVRPQPFWQPGQNTLSRNLIAGLTLLEPHERVVIVEDDDQYAPWWLHVCNQRLDTHDLIGETHSIYRHLETGREREMGNANHASMCSTAFTGDMASILIQVCEDNPNGQGLDVRFWRRIALSQPQRAKLYAPEPRGVTGIKGYPGRPGIGIGHRMR